MARRWSAALGREGQDQGQDGNEEHVAQARCVPGQGRPLGQGRPKRRQHKSDLCGEQGAGARGHVHWPVGG